MGLYLVACKNKQDQAEYARRWRKHNLRKCAEYSRIWRERNPEKAKEIMRKHDAKRREERLRAASQWRKQNPVLAAERARRDKGKKLAFLRKIREQPCFDCGKCFHFSAMDFDHRPGEVKSFTITVCVTYSWKRIMKEVQKCDIVCSNCHRIRTWNRNSKKITWNRNSKKINRGEE